MPPDDYYAPGAINAQPISQAANNTGMPAGFSANMEPAIIAGAGFD